MSGDPVAVLAACRVRKSYEATVALDEVDFAVHEGHVHALIGENGAGKSTLVKILAGVEQPTSGALLHRGRPVVFSSPRDAGALGISIIHQELQLFPDLTVAENLFVGRERRRPWGTVDLASQRRAASAVLARLGQDLSPDARLGTLPLGQQQIVEIARALVHDIRVLMMDEPTSALTASEIPTLFRVIRELTAQGVAIVYISHRLEELLSVSDHVTVLRDGRVVGQAPRADVDVPWIVTRMTGRSVRVATAAADQHGGGPVLQVSNLSLPPRAGRSAVRDVSFTVRAGEVLGLYGLMGAGRTELLESILGVHADAQGLVRLGERPLQGLDVAARIETGVAMVPEDRQASGLVPTMTVGDNLTLSMLSRLAPRGYVAPARATAAASAWVDHLRIKIHDMPGTHGLRSSIGTLSGGNQQKVVIARGAMTRPKVLLMDEPTRGVDVGAKVDIVDAMRRLAADGVAIVFATSDIAEIQAAASRVLVMSRGRIAADLAGDAITSDALASAASQAPEPQDQEAHGHA